MENIGAEDGGGGVGKKPAATPFLSTSTYANLAFYSVDPKDI